MIFSIVIPTFNRNELLNRCLELLTFSIQDLSYELYEVIVTDDSIDNQAKKLIDENFDWVKWVQGPKKGPAANRNNGVKFSKGKWIIFTDDDCLPQKGWLKSYLFEIQQNGHYSYVFEGRTIADRPKQRFDEESPINFYGDRLWSCNFAIKRDFFLKLGGFDESFPYPAMEDVDFYIRVKREKNISFVPQALVVHPWRRIKPFKTFNKHLKSHIHFAKKYKNNGNKNLRWGRLKVFIGSLFFNFKELVSYSMKGWVLYIERCVLNFCLIFI